MATVQVSNVQQRLTQPIYDSGQIATSGTTKITLFQNPWGSGTTIFGSGAKNYRDTNLTQAGQLPTGWSFQVQAIALVLASTAATMFADMVLVMQNAWLEFFLGGGSQSVFQAPAIILGGGAGVDGVAATSQTTVDRQSAHLGAADPRAVFPLGQPIDLTGGQSFYATLNWSSAPSPTAAVNATLLLHGELVRQL